MDTDTTGCSREDVLALVAGYHALDTPTTHIGFNVHCPAEDKRGWIPTVCRNESGWGTAKVETLLIESLGELQHCRTTAGCMTSGGTEPNIVVPDSARFFFDKIADMLDVELRIAPYKEGKFTVDTG